MAVETRGEEGEGYPIATHQKERFDKQNPPRIVVKHYLIYLFKAYETSFIGNEGAAVSVLENMFGYILHIEGRRERERGREKYRMYSYT